MLFSPAAGVNQEARLRAALLTMCKMERDNEALLIYHRDMTINALALCLLNR